MDKCTNCLSDNLKEGSETFYFEELGYLYKVIILACLDCGEELDTSAMCW